MASAAVTAAPPHCCPARNQNDAPEQQRSDDVRIDVDGPRHSTLRVPPQDHSACVEERDREPEGESQAKVEIQVGHGPSADSTRGEGLSDLGKRQRFNRPGQTGDDAPARFTLSETGGHLIAFNVAEAATSAMLVVNRKLPERLASTKPLRAEDVAAAQ